MAITLGHSGGTLHASNGAAVPCECCGGPPAGGCACGIDAIASLADAESTDPVPVSITANVSHATDFDANFASGVPDHGVEYTMSLSWSGDLERRCGGLFRIFSPGTTIGSLSFSAYDGAYSNTASADLELYSVDVNPRTGLVVVAVRSVNIVNNNCGGQESFRGLCLSSQSYTFSLKPTGPASGGERPLRVQGPIAGLVCCAETTGTMASDMSSFSFTSTTSCSFERSLGTESQESVESISGTVGAMRSCGITGVPDECDPGDPVPPGEPPVDPPPDGCCPNGSGLYWVDQASLVIPTEVRIRRIRKSNDQLDREWYAYVPGQVTYQDASCEQYRDTIQGQRNAAGGGQSATIPLTECYAFDPQGFSNSSDYPSPGASTLINTYMALTVEFGNDGPLPNGASYSITIRDGVLASSPNVFTAKVEPGNVVTVSSGSAGLYIPTAVLNDLRTTGQNLYSVSAGGDPFFYAASLGFRTGDTDTVATNLFRWEIEVYTAPTAGSFGPCPTPDAVALLTGGRLRYDSDCGCVRDAEGGVR